MQIAGYKFKDRKYLERAVIHTSFAHEHKMNTNDSNERLEFLGDAVLELTMSAYLFDKYPQMPEGELTKLRASLVCEQTLSQLARRIELGSRLKLGRGEDATGGRRRDSILADAFEAVIGAIYLDGGMENAREFILSQIGEEVENKHKSFKQSDYKTFLQEVIQKNSKLQLEYKILSEKGPDHKKDFAACVIHEGKILGKGNGGSKKEAEQNAALEALKMLGEV